MRFETEEGPLDFTPRRLVVAGWTGRDEAALKHHIAELAEIGVKGPSRAPLFYSAAAALMTTASEIEALGPQTSGEVEPLVIRARGALWLGLGSDHTDRGLEAVSVNHSKQICPKIAAAALWRLDTVMDPDAVELRSWIAEDGAWTLYQEGRLSEIRPLGELIAGAALGEEEAIFCGTIPAIGGIRPAPRFRMALRDPGTGREIGHEYQIRSLPVVQ